MRSSPPLPPTHVHHQMAAYSAYRHVELDKVGFGKRRVLKPPGGGTSDLFASPPDQADSPRKARAPNTLPMRDPSPEAQVPVFKAVGNPATGEGYETGKSSDTSPQNGNAAAVLRNRVPPGGYSSGLW